MAMSIGNIVIIVLLLWIALHACWIMRRLDDVSGTLYRVLDETKLMRIGQSLAEHELSCSERLLSVRNRTTGEILLFTCWYGNISQNIVPTELNRQAGAEVDHG
jgi:hypothetical protein